jgi:hypothetical protein
VCTPERRYAKAEAAVKFAGGVVHLDHEQEIAAELVVKENTTLDSVGKAVRPVLGRIELQTCNGGFRGAVHAHSRTHTAARAQPN